MAELTVTPTSVAIVFDQFAEVYDFIAAVALSEGDAVYLNANGLVALADANAAGLEQVIGVCVTRAAAGQAVSVLRKGTLYGFDLSAQSPGAAIYLSDTPGVLADAASITKTVGVGRVVVLSDKPNYTKVLFVDAHWNTQY